VLQAHAAIETNLFHEGAFLAEVRRRQAAGLGTDLMLLPGSTARAWVEADLARGLISLWIGSSGPSAGAQQHLPAAGTGPRHSGLAQGQVEADPGGERDRPTDRASSNRDGRGQDRWLHEDPDTSAHAKLCDLLR
jgi:hypothetical protein